MKSECLFVGNLRVDYSQFYIECQEPDTSESEHLPFYGQKNGLCGAAIRNHLCFIASPMDCVIPLQVHLYQSEPPFDNDFQEIVEVSFQRGMRPVFLCEWAHKTEHSLDLPEGEYRIRYSITGLDRDYVYEGCDEYAELKPIEGQIYLIQIWLHPIEPDEILKQTTEQALYWHNAHGE